MSAPGGSREGWREAAVVSLVLSGAGVYVWMQLHQGWIPHDEGTLGQSALRVLRGELPHADFDAMYTGGLAVLHAMAFEVGGIRLTVPRYVLWGAFMLWMPAAYWIARRFVGPLLASVGLLLMVAWSVPNYPAAMPSWYNLFLATFGTAAMLRYLESRRRRWLVLAGVCGGVSILIKIIGVYFLAAAGLFLVALEQSEASVRTAPEAGESAALAYRVAVFGLCAAAVAALARTVHVPGRMGNLVYFVLPVALLVLLLVWKDRSMGLDGSASRFRDLVSTAVPLGAGAAVPVLLFLVPYVGSGALDELARGLFVLPARRLSDAAAPMAGPRTWGPALLLLSPVALAVILPRRWRWGLAAITGAVGGWVVVEGQQTAVYRVVWSSIRPLLPLIVIGGVGVLARRHADEEGGQWDQRDLGLFLLLAVAALCGLVQFPFGATIYFMYVAPIAVLAALAAVSAASGRASQRPVVLVLLCFHLIFAARWLNTGFIRKMGLRYQPNPHTARLELPRGGLLVPEFEKREYENLVAALDEHARGRFIYAGPDSPEVYYLSGRRNPTRALFEFLSVDDPRGSELLSVLREHGVTAVAINRHPAFSDPLEERTLELLSERYPRSTRIGHFLVRWQ